MHSRWMQSEVVNTGQWWSDEDKPDSYINIGRAFMLNNGSRFRSTRHCPTISFCRQTHTAANISDGTNKRNPELIVTPWYANKSWIDTITAPHFGNHPVWLSPIGLYQIHYGPPCLAPPYSTPTLNARREEINVAMETSRLLTGANFCLHQSDSIESWRDSSKLIAHIGADLKHLDRLSEYKLHLFERLFFFCCCNDFLLNKSHSTPYCGKERRLAIDLARQPNLNHPWNQPWTGLLVKHKADVLLPDHLKQRQELYPLGPKTSFKPASYEQLTND